MKAILEFDLSDPDDIEDHKMMLKARSYYCALWDISQEIFRRTLKYEELSNEVYEAIDKLRTQFHDVLDANGITLE